MTKSRNLIGARVRQARMTARPPLTQEELAACLTARELRLGRVGVSKIETGSRAVLDVELVALAECLGVTVTWLLGIAPG